jgi:hypothetical protein
MTSRSTRSLAVLAAAAAVGLAGAIPTAMARHGADDPAGHDAGDDHGGKRVKVRHARHGAHHRGHHHGGRGHDDGPNHR